MKKLFKIGGLTLCALLATSISLKASFADLILGDAAGWSVLTYNSSNVSDSAFKGAPIGVVNGDWNQSGGGQTNTQPATTVYLSPGFHNNGPAIETTVFNSSKLNSAWTDAVHASAIMAAGTPDQTFGAINSALTISESAVGHYVFNISSINLNQSALTLSAPAGSVFVLNIAGDITLNGGSPGGGILVAGGLDASDVFINLTGVNSSLTTSGGNNSQQIFGNVFATGTNASVNLHPGQINGSVIARTFTSSSGSLVITPPHECPDCVITQFPEYTPSPVIFGFIGLVVAFGSRRTLMARAMATQRK